MGVKISRGGKWERQSNFYYGNYLETAGASRFNEHHTEATLPTLYFTDVRRPIDMSEGKLEKVFIRIKELTAGDKYKARLWVYNVDATTLPYTLQYNKIFDSTDFEPWLLSDEEYDLELHKPVSFILAYQGILYYGLEWFTGAAPAGNMQGFFRTEGERTK